jgi:hypothetical protein
VDEKFETFSSHLMEQSGLKKHGRTMLNNEGCVEKKFDSSVSLTLR